MTTANESAFDLMLREAAELRVPTPDLQRLPRPGELLQDKYRIEEKLGEGGMGAIFRATHVENGKPVAVKWLLSGSAQAARRFSREAQIAAQLDHPNVVNVFDLGTHRGGRYLVMELLRGQSLGARMRDARIAPRELVEIMIPVLRGVAAAHGAGVIHRDLKPDNVFLCVGPDSAARDPKVLDFGVSKVRNAKGAEEPLTGEGTGLGTLAYMSPEQLVDALHVDERADIYAAGVMMYEGLAGRLPFRAESYNALVLAIAAQVALPIRALAPDVHPILERIVMRAMAKDPTRRHPTAQTLIQELEAWLAASTREEPDAIPRAVPSERNRALSSRTRLRGAVPWAFAACLSLACGLAFWQGRTKSSERALDPPARQASAQAAGEASSAANDPKPTATSSATSTATMASVAKPFEAAAKPSASRARASVRAAQDTRMQARSRAGGIRLSDL